MKLLLKILKPLELNMTESKPHLNFGGKLKEYPRDLVEQHEQDKKLRRFMSYDTNK